MLRTFLLSLSAVAGATGALAGATPAAQAAPVALAVTSGPAHVQSVAYYEDWRHREWRRREAIRRHRAEEWRRRHELRHGW